MVDYLLTTFTTQGTLLEVVAALETQLETVDNGKTIYLLDVRLEGHQWHGIAIYAT